VHFPSDPGLGIQVDETHVRRLSTASFHIGERR
jgi:L-alanine-DL-glutamate epimerase-like enolase superfamily enzyme